MPESPAGLMSVKPSGQSHRVGVYRGLKDDRKSGVVVYISLNKLNCSTVP